MKPTPLITPAAGGKLLTGLSADSVGPLNYVRKVNFRRDGDVEARREGWVRFKPNAGFGAVPQSNPTGGADGAYMADVTDLYNYHALTVRTGEYHSDPSGPFGYLPGPGAITTYHPYDVDHNGRIDLTELLNAIEDGNNYALPPSGVPLRLLAENVRPNSDRCVIAATATTIYKYVYSTGLWTIIGSGFSASGKRWQWVCINGWIILNNGVDLPVSYRVEDSAVVPLKELREVGIASVRWIAEYNGFLMCMNVVVIKDTDLATVMNSGTPYGLVDSSHTFNVPYRILWPEFGLPTSWAPLFKVTVSSASATIALPFPSSVFVAGVTRVAVINGGPNGTTLGGDDAHPDGILVTAVAGANITLELSTDGALTYPREIQITRWTDQSTISAFKDLQGDASHIIGGKKIAGLFAVYRTRGIYMGRYTGVKGAPFDWRERCGTTNVPGWPEAIVDIKGEYHLFPCRDGRFYYFDGVNTPEVHEATDGFRTQFFEGLTATSDVWSINNPITKEAWFCRAGFSLCFDHEQNTGSEIDATIDAAAFVSKPGWEDDWFILSVGGVVYTYGRYNDNPVTWLRDGVNPGGLLKWGLNPFGDTLNEKILDSYLWQFSDAQAAIAMQLLLYGRPTAAPDNAETLLDETFPDPRVDGGLVPVEFLATYFQDEIRIAGNEDRDVRFVGRLMERMTIGSRGSARNNA